MIYSISILVFEVEIAFKLSRSPKNDRKVFEARESVQFGNESFAEQYLKHLPEDDILIPDFLFEECKNIFIRLP